MEIYRYKNMQDYLYHIKSLIKEGITWCSGCSEKIYKTFYYRDICVYVNKDLNRLSYGDESGAEEYDVEIQLYTRKKSNVVNY